MGIEQQELEATPISKSDSKLTTGDFLLLNDLGLRVESLDEQFSAERVLRIQTLLTGNNISRREEQIGQQKRALLELFRMYEEEPVFYEMAIRKNQAIQECLRHLEAHPFHQRYLGGGPVPSSEVGQHNPAYLVDSTVTQEENKEYLVLNCTYSTGELNKSLREFCTVIVPDHYREWFAGRDERFLPRELKASLSRTRLMENLEIRDPAKWAKSSFHTAKFPDPPIARRVVLRTSEHQE